MTTKKFHILSIILITVLGFGIYANSLRNEFVYDEGLIVNNKYIRSWTNLPQIFAHNLGAGTGIESNYYRPLNDLIYLIVYSFGGLNPWGYHLVNILLHILVGVSLYFLLHLLFARNNLALISSLLFIAHPVHTGAVTAVTGTQDPLCALFILLSLILFLKYRRGNQPAGYLLSLVCFILALLSKEVGLLLPLLLVAHDYIFIKKEERNFKTYLPFLLLGVLYLILRIPTLQLPLGSGGPNFFQRLPGVFVAISTYLRLLVLPFWMHVEYGNKMFSLGDPLAISGLLIVIGSLTCTFKLGRSNKLLTFAVSWFYLNFLFTLNLFPVGAYLREHWLYLPSLGFFLLLGQILLKGWEKSPNWRIFSGTILILLLTFYSTRTIQQNLYWKEPLSFYERTLRFAPGSAELHVNLGNVYVQKGRPEKAIAQYQRALQIKPNFAPAHSNLGNVYSEMGLYGKAVKEYTKALRINPESAGVYYNLGNAFRKQGRMEEAIAAYKKAIVLDPEQTEAYKNLAIIYSRRKE